MLSHPVCYDPFTSAVQNHLLAGGLDLYPTLVYWGLLDFKVTFDDTGCNNRSVQAKDHITKKSEHVFSMV